MEEIHGGKPPVLIHPDDADGRGIADGDVIEVPTPAVGSSPGHTSPILRSRARSRCTKVGGRGHFKAGKGVNELTSSAVNPIHEVHYVPNMWAPSHRLEGLQLPGPEGLR